MSLVLAQVSCCYHNLNYILKIRFFDSFQTRLPVLVHGMLMGAYLSVTYFRGNPNI